jgi:hypothetical protein
MLKIEEFSDDKRHPRNTFEGKMARAYREAVEDLESARSDFENPVPQIDDQERRLKEIRSDIENFMTIVGSYSRHEIAQKFNRCKLDLANAKRKAHNILKRAIQENPGLSPDNVEKLDVVQAAFTKRDAIIVELKPVIAELTKKLMKAEEILVKYG